MTTYIGESVYANLCTDLAEIGDSSTTWAQTKRPQVLRGKAHDRALPTKPLLVVTHYETFERVTSTPHYDVVSTITVRCHFDAQTWNPDTDASAWTHDLIKAVRDHTLSDEVVDCNIQSIAVGLPDPDGDVSCKIVMTLRANWRVLQTSPSTHIA